MTLAEMSCISLVVRNAQYRAGNPRDTGENFYETIHHGASGLAGTRDGRFVSKILKILPYSSAHDDGLTKE